MHTSPIKSAGRQTDTPPACRLRRLGMHRSRRPRRPPALPIPPSLPPSIHPSTRIDSSNRSNPSALLPTEGLPGVEQHLVVFVWRFWADWVCVGGGTQQRGAGSNDHAQLLDPQNIRTSTPVPVLQPTHQAPAPAPTHLGDPRLAHRDAEEGRHVVAGARAPHLVDGGGGGR